MKRNLIETLMGAVVLVIAGFFVFTTYQSNGIKKDYGYRVSAAFDHVDGISTGSDVRLGGIKVGTVLGSNLDPDTYRAKLSFGIEKDIHIPTDSTAAIVSDGLLGGKYISIVPGAEVDMLHDGGEIQYTQSSVNLEQLIGKIAFGGTDSNNAEKKPADHKPAGTPVVEVKAEAKPEIKPEPASPVVVKDEPKRVYKTKKIRAVEPEPAPTPAAEVKTESVPIIITAPTPSPVPSEAPSEPLKELKSQITAPEPIPTPVAPEAMTPASSTPPLGDMAPTPAPTSPQ